MLDLETMKNIWNQLNVNLEESAIYIKKLVCYVEIKKDGFEVEGFDKDDDGVIIKGLNRKDDVKYFKNLTKKIRKTINLILGHRKMNLLEELLNKYEELYGKQFSFEDEEVA